MAVKLARLIKIRAMGIILVSILLLGGVFIYMGGYWEHMPVLKKISGPMRFKQYVGDPASFGVSNLSGGYTGFPQGAVITTFNLDKAISDTGILPEWSLADSSDRRFEVRIINLTGKPEYTLYTKKVGNSERFLVIGKESKKGILYIP